MTKLLKNLFMYQISFLFILTLCLTPNITLANGDYGYDGPIPKVNCDCKCPPVNVECSCPSLPATITPKVMAEPAPVVSQNKIVTSIGLRLGYHAYTANEFLNSLPKTDQAAYNSPSTEQPLPALEGEVNVSILKYFSVSALVGTYSGENTNSLGDISRTQTIYLLVMPRFDYSFAFELANLPVTLNPYVGLGIGTAYYTFWQDPSIYIFPPPTAIDESNWVFAYSPSVGFDIPLIYVKPDLADPPFGIDKSRLKLLMDYRYLDALDRGFNAGGHLFLVGLGMDF